MFVPLHQAGQHRVVKQTSPHQTWTSQGGFVQGSSARIPQSPRRLLVHSGASSRNHSTFPQGTRSALVVQARVGQCIYQPAIQRGQPAVQCIQPAVRTLPRSVVIVPHTRVQVARHLACQVRHYECVEARSGLMEIPEELLQDICDWLPSFGVRARLRAVCSSARGLEWRRAAPFHVEEELSNLCLGDVGASAIASGLLAPRNVGLRELCLGGNGIANAGAEALAKVLASGRTQLRRLSLRDNRISDQGAAMLAEALAQNTTLEELDLWGNSISTSGRQTIIAAAKCEVFLELPSHRSQISPATTDPEARAILFDWISQVHQSIAMAVERAPDPQDMLFRTYSHVDAYLAQCLVRREELELVGLACTLVSTRLEMHTADSLECTEMATWLAYMTDGSSTAEAVLEAARGVSCKLGNSLHQPTVYTFLRRYLRHTGWTEASFSLANYLVELAALDPAFLEFRPQAVAAAAAVLSRQYQSQGIEVRSVPHWKARLLRCADMDLRRELAPCAAAMSQLHAAQPRAAKNLFVHQKFESPRLHSVARLQANPPTDVKFFEVYMATDAASSVEPCR
jgi:hypothetical protein